MKLFSLPRMLIASMLILVAAIPSSAQTNCIYDNGPHACIVGSAGDVFIYDLSGTGVITFSNADGSVVYGTYDLRAEMDATIGAPGPISVPFGTFGPFTLNILVFQNGDVSYQVDYVSGDVALSETPPTPHVPGSGAGSGATPGVDAGNVPPPLENITTSGGAIIPATGTWRGAVTDFSVACTASSFFEFERAGTEANIIRSITQENGFIGGDNGSNLVTVEAQSRGRILLIDGAQITRTTLNPTTYADNLDTNEEPGVSLTQIIGALAITVESSYSMRVDYVINVNYPLGIECNIVLDIAYVFVS